MAKDIERQKSIIIVGGTEQFNTIVKLDHDFADEFTKDFPDAKFLNMFKPTDIMAQKIANDFSDINVNDVVKHLDSFVDIMGDNGFIEVI